MHYLYRITNQLNNKVYIGQAVNPPRRWQDHKYNSTRPNPPQYIHRAMAKYGIDNFIYEVIATCKTQEDADITEILLIKQYDSRNSEKGYNIAPGGSNMMSEETKRKISEAKKGMILSEEHKQNISQAHKDGKYDHIVTDEYRAKLSEAHKGNKSRIGQNQSEAERAKKSEIWKQKFANGYVNPVRGKPSKRRIAPEIEQLIITAYQNCQTYKSIQNKFNVSENTITNIMKRNGILLHKCKL